MYVGSFFSCDKKLIAKTPVFVVSDQVIGNVRNEKIQLEMTVGGGDLVLMKDTDAQKLVHTFP